MNHENWIELAADACKHAGIDPETIEIIATWDQKYCANAVYRISGQRYLKIYGPTAERQFHIERSVLQTLVADTTIPAPHIVGERSDQPPYLIITAIAGTTAEELWEGLSRAEQLKIARDIGAITAAIHRLPQADLAAVEAKFGGRLKHIERMQVQRIAEIQAIETFAQPQRDALIRLVQGEARELLDQPLHLTHFDLAHNHIYLTRETGAVQIAGVIDWGEAMLGVPEWDVVYLWFWTFSCDREAMRECLQTLYADNPLPQRFARRCLAAVLYTPSMGLLWPHFAEQSSRTDAIAREMTAFFFPAEVFGSPD